MQGYRPLVYAFNHALRALHKIDVLLRKSPKLSLLFHRNHPKPITATHNDHPSTRNPDIILVSLEAAQKAFSEGDPGTWDDHASTQPATRQRMISNAVMLYLWGNSNGPRGSGRRFVRNTESDLRKRSLHKTPSPGTCLQGKSLQSLQRRRCQNH